MEVEIPGWHSSHDLAPVWIRPSLLRRLTRMFFWMERRAGSESTLDKTLLTYDDSVIPGFFQVSSVLCQSAFSLSSIDSLPTVGGAWCHRVLLATLSVLMERQLPVTVCFVTAAVWPLLLNTSYATGFQALVAGESPGRLDTAGIAGPAPGFLLQPVWMRPENVPL